jgi:uncharacterized protein YkwD
MHRLLRSIGIIGLLCVIGFSPEVADATTPTTIIRTEKSTAQISQGQKIQQNVRLRRNSRRIPSIEARLQQKRPVTRVPRVSQRQRRAELSPSAIQQRSLERRTDRVQKVTPVRTSDEERALKDAIIRAVNRERSAFELPLLSPNAILESSAQQYAEDMERRNFFSHTSPEGEGPQQRIEHAGYAALTSETCKCRGYYASFGENLAKGQQSVEDVMTDWMRSPDHRKNILSTLFTEIGIGIKGYLWVQHFGSVEIEAR